MNYINTLMYHFSKIFLVELESNFYTSYMMNFSSRRVYLILRKHFPYYTRAQLFSTLNSTTVALRNFKSVKHE